VNKTILVVDDCENYRLVVGRTLAMAGYEVVEAIDGQDAAEKLDRAMPSLIVCDLNMPRMDGLGFARHVKASLLHHVTPMIMLTTETKESKKTEGRAAGVREWIAKPFQRAQLLAAVGRHCA